MSKIYLKVLFYHILSVIAYFSTALFSKIVLLLPKYLLELHGNLILILIYEYIKSIKYTFIFSYFSTLNLRKKI